MAKKAAVNPPVQPYIPPTPQERATRLVKSFGYKLDRAKDTIASFVNQVNDRPGHALEWSSSAFSAAAEIEVYNQALQILTDEDGNPVATKERPEVKEGQDKTLDTLKWLTEYATDKVVSKARSNERSTSPTGNLMERERLVAWANVLEIIKWNS